MAGNRIQIRRGSGTPSGLLSYELGWDYTNKILYITNVENNAGILRKIGGEGAFLLLTGGTMTGSITGSNSGVGFIQKLNDTSNWGLGLSWQKATAYSESYRPGIGYHNTGDTNGALTLVPYATNTSPWNGTVGLYVGKNTFKWENNVILHSNNYTTYTVTKTGTGASGSWGISITGTATKASGLVDGTSTMTSAYNKAGLAYADYTYLAGWNGYELRAVAKTQFAQASHTHSYLPLTGGTVTGTLTVGSSSAASSSSHALWTTGITVHDTRYDAISVTSLSKAINFFFSNNGTPNTNWWAGMHVAGWTGDYNAWELVGPSHSSDQRTQNLYMRVGRTSNGWGAWRALVTSSDTTSRRIFVTTSASVPSGAVAGDIVLVKA